MWRFCTGTRSDVVGRGGGRRREDDQRRLGVGGGGGVQGHGVPSLALWDVSGRAGSPERPGTPVPQ